MSLAGSGAILAVCAARLCLRRAPKGISYALWAAVLFNLLCPVKPSSPISFAPEGEVGIGLVGEGAGFTAAHMALAVLWLLGAAAMLARALLEGHRLKKRLGPAVRLNDGVYEAEGVSTPFVWGPLRPKVYLPKNMKPEWRPLILAHERVHLRRRDDLLGILSFFALALHWFNPLAWLAYRLMLGDRESAADEAVLRNAGADIRRDYALALLCLAGEAAMPARPAFGGQNLKERVKKVLEFQKQGLAARIAAAAFAALLGLALLFGWAGSRRPPAMENSMLRGLVWRGAQSGMGLPANADAPRLLGTIGMPGLEPHEGEARPEEAQVIVFAEKDEKSFEIYFGEEHVLRVTKGFGEEQFELTDPQALQALLEGMKEGA
ncbi:MAG: M56 family metallopeptidase [Christensenellaceae bacterium]|jgi:beta-lactamase regulating signal transducer with metallopeptidase domain|nr:M56 family metallopeptidase [Christensenellaceae bacterium]